MTMPDLPPPNDRDWYAHYAALDKHVRNDGAVFRVHGDDASVARPDTLKPVVWVGTVDPDNGDSTKDVVLYSTGAGTGGSGVTTELDAKANRTLTKRVVTGSYTVVVDDATDRVLHVTSDGAVTVTLPSDSAAAVPQETSIAWRQYGLGQITFAAGTGASLRARGSAYKSAGQDAEGIVTKVAANTWLVSGDTTA